MTKHHPDRGGDVVTAAQVNETYNRMVEWLKRRERRTAKPTPQAPDAPLFGAKARTAAIAIGSAAILALAALRGGRKA